MMHRESRADLPREAAAGVPVLQVINTEAKYADMRITDLSTIRGMYKGAEHAAAKSPAEMQLPVVTTDDIKMRVPVTIPDMADLSMHHSKRPSTHLRTWDDLQAVRKSAAGKRRILL